MASSNSYQQILDEYPEYITKEQLYQICHISKKSAQNLLESGEIPCIDSGRKTHRFLIATADVVDYLQRRDSAPRPAADETAVEKIRAALALYPDVLSVAQVSELTGRRSSTVTKWCRLNYIENIYAGGKTHIPKASLADFLVSRWEEFQNIGEKEAVAVIESTTVSGQISNLNLSDLQPFSRHPYKVRDDEAMRDMVESIKQYGVLSPAIARPMPDGGYELVSGHRRKRACELAGLETMPVIVRELDDDAAAILVVDSNLQREGLLPSERAFAYKLKLEALRHRGERTDLTSSRVGMKLQALDIVGRDAGDSRNQVHRYIWPKSARGARRGEKDSQHVPARPHKRRGTRADSGADGARRHEEHERLYSQNGHRWAHHSARHGRDKNAGEPSQAHQRERKSDCKARKLHEPGLRERPRRDSKPARRGVGCVGRGAAQAGGH